MAKYFWIPFVATLVFIVGVAVVFGEPTREYLVKLSVCPVNTWNTVKNYGYATITLTPNKQPFEVRYFDSMTNKNINPKYDRFTVTPKTATQKTYLNTAEKNGYIVLLCSYEVVLIRGKKVFQRTVFGSLPSDYIVIKSSK